MLKKFSFFLILTGLVLNAEPAALDYLARIPAPGALYDLSQTPGVALLEYFGSGVIARVNADAIKDLTTRGYQPEVLETLRSNGAYFVAWDAGYSEGKAILESWGKIFCAENGAYVVWVPDPDGFVMNKGPLMLNRIGKNPMVVTKDNGERPPALMANPYVQAMVSAVRVDSTMAALRRLQNYRNRHSSSDSCRAAVTWTGNKFRAYRARTPQDTVIYFNWSSTYANDVYMDRPGYVHAETIAVIGGHIDDVSNPGADDNATGTVAAIEAARVMKGYDFELTARFCAFPGEEQGLLGSDTLASFFYRRGDRIKGMLNYDMIGHVDIAPESLDIHGRTGTSDDWLMNFVKAAADTYTTMKVVLIKSNLSGSDHASFWAQGWTAICGIEDYPLHNPAYHTQGDTIGTGPNAGVNDTLWFVNSVRSAVAAFALICRPFRSNSSVDDWPPGQQPSHITLAPIRPNPSTGLVSIRFFLPRAREFSISVYDRAGRTVKDFRDNVLPIGGHEIFWDGKSDRGEPMSSGVYFIKLQVENETRTMPLVLIR